MRVSLHPCGGGVVTVGPRTLAGDPDGFATREPTVSRTGPPVIRIGVGIARSLVLAIGVGIEKGTITGLGDYRLRQRRCGDRGRQNGHRRKKLQGRHRVSPLGSKDIWRITPKPMRPSLLVDHSPV